MRVAVSGQVELGGHSWQMNGLEVRSRIWTQTAGHSTLHTCVVGSPIDCAATVPTTSPGAAIAFMNLGRGAGEREAVRAGNRWQAW